LRSLYRRDIAEQCGASAEQDNSKALLRLWECFVASVLLKPERDWNLMAAMAFRLGLMSTPTVLVVSTAYDCTSEISGQF